MKKAPAGPRGRSLKSKQNLDSGVQGEDASDPGFWPTFSSPVYIDGTSPSAVAEVRAVAFPTRITMSKNGRYYLGTRCVEAYNGRGERVSISSIPYPGENIHFEFYKNPPGNEDHTGYVKVKSEQEPTYQLYLQGLDKKTGIIVLRCWPLMRLDDGTKQLVYIRHVFADIEVEVV